MPRAKTKKHVTLKEDEADEELRTLVGEVFDLLDPEGSEYIPTSAVAEAATALGLPASRAAVRVLTRSLTLETEGSIHRDTFIPVMLAKLGVSSSSRSPSPSIEDQEDGSEYDAEAEHLFSLFDTTGKGYIDGADIALAAASIKETSLEPDDISDMLQIAAQDTAHIYLEDFSRLLSRLKLPPA